MNRFLVTCAALAMASGAVAQQAVQPGHIPAGVGVKRMYINLRTGERRITEVTPRMGPEQWGYDPGTDGSGFYAPTWGTGGYGWTDTEVWDSGQLASNVHVDGVEFWYYAAGSQPADATFPMAFALSDDYELCGGVYPTLTSGVFAFDAPADPNFSWIITLDLAGFEFDLTGDGTDFGYGLFGDTAAGVDGAGNPVDIGATGLIIVNDNATTAPGAFDAFEGLPDTASGFGCWYFGGTPFAQFYIKVFGEGSTGCPADFNGDGFLDFFDYDDYIACFQDGICPPGKDADFNGDGFVDFFDYDDFVAAFETGC